MPPKAPAGKAAGKSRSPSPATKAAGAKGATSKAVAGSSAQSPPAKKSATSAGAAPGKGASSSDPVVAPPPTLAPESAIVIIQRVGKGYLDRVPFGSSHKKYLSKKTAKEAEDRIFAHSRRERQLREKQKQVEKEAETKEQQRRRLLEAFSVASFEGNLPEMKKLVSQGVDLYGKDQQGNHAVGEAAVNGMVDAVKYLLDQGCDPNVKGEYDRTPMWRAAFNNHTEVIRVLLERGGDPRLRAQSQIPEELCGPEGKALIAAWDLSKTDAMVTKYQAILADRESRRKAEAQKVTDQLTSSSDDLKHRLDSKKKELIHHKQEFEKRVVEYDIVNCDGTKPDELKKVALECVKTAEADVAKTTAEVAALQEEYCVIRTQLALHNHQELGEALEGTEFPFKKLADVVFDDSDSMWKPSGKWPLVVDVSGRSRTFLKYRNVVFVDTFNPHQMEADGLRRAILGALRYGKPMVVDLRDVPMFASLEERINSVTPGLYRHVLSKEILKKDVFSKLFKPQDGPELAADKFSSVTAEEASFIFVSSALGVDDAVGAHFTLLRVED